MTSSSVPALKAELAEFIPSERLIDDPLRTLAYGTDASFYRLVPQLVVKVRDEAEVSRLLCLAEAYQTPVTFRAAGTSLSGQAITDSVLVLLDGNAWRDYHISEDATEIRLQPGIIGEQANRYLAPFGRKIGPDPASIAACKIGGIAANNASGMCCGVAQNSYQTLVSMRLVLADGSLLDTGDAASVEAFRGSHQALIRDLEALIREVQADVDLAARITHKFMIKNTTGYSLNALTDYSDPIDVLQHLMIGSEGTLGFISEITYRTVVEHPHRASALVSFGDVEAACHAVARLKEEPVDAVEIMDRAALRSVQDQPGIPELLTELPDEAAALLIETRAATAEKLRGNIDHILASLEALPTFGDIAFTDVPEEFARLWKIRKGLFPSVGAVRALGTTVVIEDIAFPVPRLAEGTLELQGLFAKHGYDNAIIFGHALEGNLHFVITPDFDQPEEVERYRRFMDELCHLVVEKYDGSLKAEHSTGRNIAPYVALEWGTQAYRLMQRIKALFDPEGLLNPGVILNDNPEIHLKDLKSMSAVDARIDRCIECGFCEAICPSRDLTLTPRQRIAVLREQARQHERGAIEFGTLPDAAFEYRMQASCAGDGLCATRCPVGIDTGEMMRTLRADGRGATARKTAAWIETHMAGVTAATRAGLTLAHAASRVIGADTLESVSATLRRISRGHLPEWHRWMPRASGKAHRPAVPAHTDSDDKRCVYFSACVSRTMGSASGDHETRDLVQVIHSLLTKAGYRAVVPEGMASQCCGLPFHSKGLNGSADQALRRLEAALWEASEEGLLPVLCDTSPCTARMIEGFEKPLQLFEPVGFIRRFLLPQLALKQPVDSVALHITCSARKMGLAGDFTALAEACANHVYQPEEEGCCGFAGDKGFDRPELNASALSRLRQQIPENCHQGVSNSRTCEIGLSRHSGIPYRSIAYLVDQCFVRRGG